ncbi:TRAP transporter substrate-binding protein [Bacillus tuaregi]|uniref:TRAP transporter substrate-binding protein n=1 Tax=Bacillus tuaregi TaxID=1816695 RepID=UPI0013563156|nr:TRAP transporter substrate-binding protein [Bacillus tuaregi]
MKKKIAFLIVLLIFIIMSAACGNEQSSGNNHTEKGAEQKIKIGHLAPENNVWHESLLKFDEELKARSDGRLRLDIYPNATLGNETDMFQQVQAGSLDMMIVTAAEMANYSDSFSAWFMPFILKDHEDSYKMAATSEALGLFDPINGVEGLGYYFAGMRHVLTKDDPITDIKDFKGASIRVTPSPAIVDFWEKIGAGPTPVPLPELYSAFQTNVVNVIDIDLDATIGNAYYEVGDQLTTMNHMVWASGVVMNEALWSDFSKEDQKMIKEALQVSIDFNKENNMEREEANLKAFKEQGGKVTELSNLDPFMKVAEEIHKKYGGQDPSIQAFIDKAKEIAK